MKTKPTLYLLFNHTLTPEQEVDAFESLEIENIIYFPKDLLDIWENIPPYKQYIKEMLYPVYAHMSKTCKEGDYVLIQGDFGATYQVVQKALSLLFLTES